MKRPDLPNVRWLIAIAVSMALHYGVFVAQPLFISFGSSQGITQSGGGVQRIVVRVMEQTPTDEKSSLSTAATKAPGIPQLANSEAGTASGAPTPMNLKAWRPDADTRFYATEEVDQPALPVLNWQLPPQTAASIRLRHLIVQVWIAENGDILNVALLSSQPEILWAHRQNIEQSLMQTQMTPAIKNGRQVASKRTLEMALEF